MVPRLPESRDAFDLASSVHIAIAAFHMMVTGSLPHCNSPDMQTSERVPTFEGKVDIRVNHENLGYVWVYDQFNNEYIKVPSTHMDYTNGLTLLQHKKFWKIKSSIQTINMMRASISGKVRKSCARRKLIILNSDRLLRERKRGARIAMKIDQISELNNSPDTATISEQEAFIDLGDIPDLKHIKLENNKMKKKSVSKIHEYKHIANVQSLFIQHPKRLHIA